MRRVPLLFAVVVASLHFFLPTSSAWPQSRSDDDTYYRYEVWGTGTLDPNRERPWSESYDTEGEAEGRLKEIRADHEKGGLLEAAPDHPLDLKIKKIPYKKSAKPDGRSEKPKRDDPALSGPKGDMLKVESKGTITVKVFQLLNNKWVEQPGRKYETATKYDVAADYFQGVKATPGWTATWNAPGWPKPNETKETPSSIPPVIGSPEAKAYNPPKPADAIDSTIIGTWVNERNNDWIEIASDGTFKQYVYTGRLEYSGRVLRSGVGKGWYDLDNGQYKVQVELDNVGGLFRKR